MEFVASYLSHKSKKSGEGGALHGESNRYRSEKADDLGDNLAGSPPLCGDCKLAS
jgi:hypothetical protein